MTLVILAAGMGSRYGGLKQLDPMTDNGEFMIDFSIYDAVGAGFDHVVFIIKEENLEIFDPYLSSMVEEIAYENVTVDGVLVEDLSKHIKEIEFDTLYLSDYASGSGKINKITKSA